MATRRTRTAANALRRQSQAIMTAGFMLETVEPELAPQVLAVAERLRNEAIEIETYLDAKRAQA